uniref:Uncharacterized protein n=1 Tax=Eutreptiella gymnastica TaxID=73025 RepID=A0A7S4GGN7_9EUGL
MLPIGFCGTPAPPPDSTADCVYYAVPTTAMEHEAPPPRPPQPRAPGTHNLSTAPTLAHTGTMTMSATVRSMGAVPVRSALEWDSQGLGRGEECRTGTDVLARSPPPARGPGPTQPNLPPTALPPSGAAPTQKPGRRGVWGILHQQVISHPTGYAGRKLTQGLTANRRSRAPERCR